MTGLLKYTDNMVNTEKEKQASNFLFNICDSMVKKSTGKKEITYYGKDGNWIFKHDFRNKMLWYSYIYIHKKLSSILKYSDLNIKNFVKSWVEINLNWKESSVYPNIITHQNVMDTNLNWKAIINNDVNDKQSKLDELVIDQKQKIKIDAYNTLMDSRGGIDINMCSKVLKIEGIGRNKLFELLRKKGILDKNNIPYQSYIMAKYFKCAEASSLKKNNRLSRIHVKVLVTQKGIDFIFKKAQKEWNKDILKLIK